MKPGSKQKISFKNTDSNSESVIKQKNVPLPKASIYKKKVFTWFMHVTYILVLYKISQACVVWLVSVGMGFIHVLDPGN